MTIGRRKAYLGDAVYAYLDDYGCLWLTTEDGTDEATNRICLEPEVYAALLEYVERAAAAKTENK